MPDYRVSGEELRGYLGRISGYFETKTAENLCLEFRLSGEKEFCKGLNLWCKQRDDFLQLIPTLKPF